MADLAVTYRARKGPRDRRLARAVDGVSFSVGAGEIFALVGESGCGKTSIVRAIARLEEPAAGQVMFRGQNIAHARRRALHDLRRQLQVVFQDPFESLDPRLTALDTVAESLIVHGIGGSGRARRELALAALAQVGLHPPEQIARRYPHQMSGGQRQRLAIAGAMVLSPDLLIADEPVSMLDVSLRAGILRLMLDLRSDRGVSILFVTHDLSLAWLIADRVAVVYLGRIVELGHGRRGHQRAAAPVHPGAGVGHPGPGGGRGARPGPAPGRGAVGEQDPRRLPVPPALPAVPGAGRAGAVPHRRPGPGPRQPRRGLPLREGDP